MRVPWIPALLVASPVLLLLAGYAASGVLDLAGAHCTGPNTPFGLDGIVECNRLGETQQDLGWVMFAAVIISVPISAMTIVGLLIGAAIGARPGSSPPRGGRSSQLRRFTGT
jgi:hypothetical protein